MYGAGMAQHPSSAPPYKDRRRRKFYDDKDAALYESIHRAMEDNPRSIQETVEAMRRDQNPIMRGHPWSFSYIEELMESEAYRQWRTDYTNFLRNNAEVQAWRFMANPQPLQQQVAANMAVSITRNDLAKARHYVDPKKAAGILRSADGDDEASETGALIGVDE